MPNLNRVMLMGNLTRDPELRYLPSNMPVVGFGLAINRKWKDQQGEQKEEVVFIDCDSAKGTLEVLRGVVPSLARDGVVFSQDFHIAPVRELLLDRRTWERYGCGDPSIERLCGHLAMVRLPQRSERRVLPDRRRGSEPRGTPRRVAAGVT